MSKTSNHIEINSEYQKSLKKNSKKSIKYNLNE